MINGHHQLIKNPRKLGSCLTRGKRKSVKLSIPEEPKNPSFDKLKKEENKVENEVENEIIITLGDDQVPIALPQVSKNPSRLISIPKDNNENIIDNEELETKILSKNEHFKDKTENFDNKIELDLLRNGALEHGVISDENDSTTKESADHDDSAKKGFENSSASYKKPEIPLDKLKIHENISNVSKSNAKIDGVSKEENLVLNELMNKNESGQDEKKILAFDEDVKFDRTSNVSKIAKISNNDGKLKNNDASLKTVDKKLKDDKIDEAENIQHDLDNPENLSQNGKNDSKNKEKVDKYQTLGTNSAAKTTEKHQILPSFNISNKSKESQKGEKGSESQFFKTIHFKPKNINRLKKPPQNIKNSLTQKENVKTSENFSPIKKKHLKAEKGKKVLMITLYMTSYQRESTDRVNIMNPIDQRTLKKQDNR